MKKLVCFLVCITLAVFCLGVLVSAEGGVTINVTDTAYGAVANDSGDDFAAFKKAFAVARTSTVPVTVIVPAGTYHIGDTLEIFSNTTVIAEGAKIIFDGTSGRMINSRHVDENGNLCKGSSCTHGGYTQCHDVTLDGGSWEWEKRSNEAEYGEKACFAFRHAKNISFKNLTVSGASNHFINVSSSCDVLFENVTFADATKCNDASAEFWTHGEGYPSETRYHTVEALHTDICDGTGENGDYSTPFDKTPPKNITVKNCTFNGVFAGVGNHHHTDGQRPENITIEGCTFKNIMTYPVIAYDFDGLTVKNCTATGISAFATLLNCGSAVLEGNSATPSQSPAIDRSVVVVNEGTSVTLSGNTFKNSSQYAVRVTGASTATVTSNTISSVMRAVHADGGSKVFIASNTIGTTSSYGISCIDCAQCEIKDNGITNTGDVGILERNCTGAVISGNTLNTTAAHGILCDDARCEIKNNSITNAGNAGILARNCSGTVISGNTLRGITGYGISPRNSTGVEITGNDVESKNSAVYAAGEESNPCTCTIKNNILKSSDAYDLYVGDYAVNCVLGGNTLRSPSFKCGANGSYTGNNGMAVLDSITLPEESYVYDGEQKTPEPTVKDTTGKVLTKGTHYSVSYDPGRKNAGTYVVTVTMKGGYSGTGSASFTITPKPVKPKVVLFNSVSEGNVEYVYNGTERTPGVRVYDGETKLSASYYTVKTPKGRINAGTYTYKVTLSGNYSGSGKASFVILPKAITPSVTLSKTSYVYNGKAKKPSVTVKTGTTVLDPSEYTVAYSSGRKNVGTYKVTVTVTGNYSGSATKTFKITKAAQPMTASGKTVSVKYSKSKATTVDVSKLLAVSNAQGKLTYAKASGSKYFTVNKTTGALTVAKGAPKGKYTVSVKVTAAGGTNYASGSKTVKVTVKIG